MYQSEMGNLAKYSMIGFFLSRKGDFARDGAPSIGEWEKEKRAPGGRESPRGPLRCRSSCRSYPTKGRSSATTSGSGWGGSASTPVICSTITTMPSTITYRANQFKEALAMIFIINRMDT